MTTKIIDSQAMGADFCWSFGNGSADDCKIPRATVERILAHHGFDPDYLPDADPIDVLKRASHLVSSAKCVVKELRRPNKDTPKAIGVYQVRTVEGEKGDNIVCGARVRVDTHRVVCLPPEGADPIDECMAVGEKMASIANELLTTAYNTELSATIVQVGRRLGWIGRRPNGGGVYYLHRESAERLARLLKDIEQVTEALPREHRFVPHITEQYDRPLTRASWAQSSQDHFAAKTSTLVKELDRMFTDGKMREKTMDARADECDKLIAQANEYSMFLSAELKPLQDRLTKIRETFRKARAEGSDSVEKEMNEIASLIGSHKSKATKATKEATKAAKKKGVKKAIKKRSAATLTADDFTI